MADTTWIDLIHNVEGKLSDVKEYALNDSIT